MTLGEWLTRWTIRLALAAYVLNRFLVRLSEQLHHAEWEPVLWLCHSGRATIK